MGPDLRVGFGAPYLDKHRVTTKDVPEKSSGLEVDVACLSVGTEKLLKALSSEKKPMSKTLIISADTSGSPDPLKTVIDMSKDDAVINALSALHEIFGEEAFREALQVYVLAPQSRAYLKKIYAQWCTGADEANLRVELRAQFEAWSSTRATHSHMLSFLASIDPDDGAYVVRFLIFLTGTMTTLHGLHCCKTQYEKAAQRCHGYIASEEKNLRKLQEASNVVG